MGLVKITFMYTRGTIDTLWWSIFGEVYRTASVICVPMAIGCCFIESLIVGWRKTEVTCAFAAHVLCVIMYNCTLQGRRNATEFDAICGEEVE